MRAVPGDVSILAGRKDVGVGRPSVARVRLRRRSSMAFLEIYCGYLISQLIIGFLNCPLDLDQALAHDSQSGDLRLSQTPTLPPSFHSSLLIRGFKGCVKMPK